MPGDSELRHVIRGLQSSWHLAPLGTDGPMWGEIPTSYGMLRPFQEGMNVT